MLRSACMRALRKVILREVNDGQETMLRDLDAPIRRIIERVRPFTMTSDERLAALCSAVAHVVKHDVAGDFVECGVWKGGSTMAAALAFEASGDVGRHLYLFDTFEGMVEPTAVDRCARTGKTAAHLLATTSRSERIWAYSPLDEVKRNIASTGYPAERVAFVKGKVEETIPAFGPEKVAILRLDTDWYESTRHELVNLYPRLSVGGVLIIDDYGHWEGARRAVDEYFEEHRVRTFLHRIDYTGRIGIKTD